MLLTKEISFFNNDLTYNLRGKRNIKNFISNYINENCPKNIVGLNIIFCSDESLLERNIYYLKHYTYTDILTFTFESEIDKEYLSDIFISIDRVKENAKTFNSTFIMELHRVIFHGVLHICGYKDKTKKAKEEMTMMEDKLLGMYFEKQ